MDCKKARETAAEDASGALSPAVKAELEAHLKGCADCREEARLLSKAWLALGGYEAPEPGAYFTRNLMEKIREGREERGFTLAGWWKVPALTLASCAVYLFCIETGIARGRHYEAQGGGAAAAISEIFSDTAGPGQGGLLSLVEVTEK